ncbi:MAG: hypothetical protein WAX89_02900, partial [Alphaproteobacteria bacterium]
AKLGKAAKQPHVYWVHDAGKAISFSQLGVVKVPETLIINTNRQLVDKVVGGVDWREHPLP